MKANELRIGNKVISFDKDWKEIIATIELVYDAHYCVKEHSSAMTFNNIKPIPLTPEILEKAGFIKYSHGFWFWRNSIFSIEKESNWWQVYYSSTDRLVNVKYLHQLQNLYYALTGEELNIQL